VTELTVTWCHGLTLSYLTHFPELSCDILPFASFFKKKNKKEDAGERGIQKRWRWGEGKYCACVGSSATVVFKAACSDVGEVSYCLIMYVQGSWLCPYMYCFTLSLCLFCMLLWGS